MDKISVADPETNLRKMWIRVQTGRKLQIQNMKKSGSLSVFSLQNKVETLMVLTLDGNSERGACNEQSLSFDLFKAVDQFEGSVKSDVFFPKRPIFMRAQHVMSYHLI